MTAVLCLGWLRRWTWPLTAASWAACRGTAALDTPRPTTLPPLWKSFSMCPPACPQTPTTPSPKRYLPPPRDHPSHLYRLDQQSCTSTYLPGRTPVSVLTHLYQATHLPVSTLTYLYKTTHSPVSVLTHRYQASHLPVSGHTPLYQLTHLPVSAYTHLY